MVWTCPLLVHPTKGRGINQRGKLTTIDKRQRALAALVLATAEKSAAARRLGQMCANGTGIHSRP
jgi:hypothetical protein